MSRSDKVAAAKRKLKKFQQRSKTLSPAKVADRSETPSGNDQSRLSADLQRGATSPRASSTDLFRQISSEASGIRAEVGRTTEKGSSLHDSDTARRSSELNDSKRFAGALKVQTTLVEDLNQQLQKQAEELNAQYQENARLRSDFRRLQSDDGGVEKLRTELLAVTEQLKGHEQTIDILVEEKSELHTKLTRQNVIIQEKTSECQELMRRLQAGSERIRQLEMALEEAHTDLQQHKQNRASDEKNSLQASVQALSNENEELKHQVSELTNKLVAQSKTSASLDGQLKEARSKLSLAETLVQQLSGGSDDAKEREEAYKAMKTQNEQLVAQLNETIRSLQSLSAEHEETKRKFQEVFNQYEGRAQALANQVSTLTNEKGLLVGRLQQQTAAVKELELKLDETVRHQSAQLDHTHTIQQLTTENENLSAHLAAMTDENRTLQTSKEEMSAKLEEYEVTVTRLGEEAVDRAKLLSDMQNDKATISRALLQNKELKSQLEELQQAFVKLTNDNMQLFESRP
ncbi:golgin subfamily A member 2-like [Oscarella lobularis]|uniref:golgin subfamily A member 2-like n=1 Tax=Oscarella lobularis TaxID=121494 RepID=UPI003313282F